MNNKTLLLVAFGGMVVLNLIALSFLVFRSGSGHREGPNGPPPGGPRGPKDFISRELGFSPDQENAFEQLRKEHFGEVKKLEGMIGERRTSLVKLYAVDDSEEEAKVLFEEISALRVGIEKVTFHHFRQVRNLCDEKQKAKFDNIIEDVMAKMSRKPPPRKRPRHQKESLP
ncbi:hypothetical protein N9933_01695 [bacterium]|nr:hypothetical protein [bacterium]